MRSESRQEIRSSPAEILREFRYGVVETEMALNERRITTNELKVMPEGHKTHYLARQHSDWFAGQTLKVTSPQGRFRADARKVTGKILESCEAAGKHLFYGFEGGRIVHVHLGRYGRFREHGPKPPPAVGAVRMRIIGSERSLDLSGPTTCRVIDESIKSEVLDRLGPDPLAGGKKAAVWANIRDSNKPIGALVLDQSVVAGVGNIFRAELFYEIGLDPRTPGKELDARTFDALWKSLTKMMRTGLKHGKIITVSRSEAGAPLATLEGGDRFRVYGKDACPGCDEPVQTIEIASRRLYWCPVCQSSKRC